MDGIEARQQRSVLEENPWESNRTDPADTGAHPEPDWVTIARPVNYVVESLEPWTGQVGNSAGTCVAESSDLRRPAAGL